MGPPYDFQNQRRIPLTPRRNAEHLGSALAVPESGRKAFVSRYNDPNHPANNEEVLSTFTGGLYVSKPVLLKRAGAAIKKSQDKKRAPGVTAR